MSRQLNQRGSAVITALFIMALVAIATTAMTYRLQIDVKRLQWITESQQLQNSLEVARYWARGTLLSNLEEDDEGGAPLKLPQTMPTNNQHQMKIDAQLQDAERFFNLNNLISANPTPEARQTQSQQIQFFANLIHEVLPEIDADTAFESAVKIAELVMTPGSSALLMAKRELPANQFVSVSELRTFPGFTQAQYERLAPFLVALPESTPLNINNASKTVIKAYMPEVEDDKLTQLLAQRKSNGGFESFEDFKNKAHSLKIEEKNLNMGSLTLQSIYFHLDANAHSETMQRHTQILLKRVKNEETGSHVDVMWQVYN